MVPVGCLKKKKDLVNKSNKIHLKEKKLKGRLFKESLATV